MIADDCVCTPSDRDDPFEIAEIIGGKKAKVGEFPWQVALITPGTKTPQCGGTLISDEWVLTSAFCTTAPFSFPPSAINPSDVEVMIGGHNWKKNKPKATFRDVVQIIIHENFNDKPCKSFPGTRPRTRSL